MRAQTGGSDSTSDTISTFPSPFPSRLILLLLLSLIPIRVTLPAMRCRIKLRIDEPIEF
jgi:hypothetical protein